MNTLPYPYIRAYYHCRRQPMDKVAGLIRFAQETGAPADAVDHDGAGHWIRLSELTVVTQEWLYGYSFGFDDANHYARTGRYLV